MRDWLGQSRQILVRKKLLGGDSPGGPQSFGHRKLAVMVNGTTSQQESPEFHLLSAEKDQERLSSNSSVSLVSFEVGGADSDHYRCQYYGCLAKNSLRFTCLDYTQICDDFIDCQDESDELDCVSLLKHDNGQHSRQLTFSNGEGIIYLNRKGSLAPMCIDYFLDNFSTSDTNNNLRAARSLFDGQPASVSEPDVAGRKQQELIRQINTVGQYACSLQSFSKLVSVKINHHSSVDDSNLIKASKHYHRLSILDSTSSSLDTNTETTTSPLPLARDKSLDGSFSSYKSSGLLGQHEVEVSTSAHCPSQRTVFVKCGSFECGQDSFSVSGGGQNDQGDAKRKGGVIINDFPWLVKLYWMGSLACHGYLIDELWLISSSECFMSYNNTRFSNLPKAEAIEEGGRDAIDRDGLPLNPASSSSSFSSSSTSSSSSSSSSSSGGGWFFPAEPWTAEISYEHYGNHDYQSIESNRRSIKDILVYPSRLHLVAGAHYETSSEPSSSALYFGFNRPTGSSVNPTPNSKSSIVLAKLERPVRFSPLNRPICLPASSSPSSGADGEEFDKLYKECVTATLPMLASKRVSPTQELLLNKVRVQRRIDCLVDSNTAGLHLDDLICVAGLSAPMSLLASDPLAGQHWSKIRADNNLFADESSRSNITESLEQADATHVLICSTIPSSRSRSRWTIVGVQNKAIGLRVQANRLLFTSVASLTDWIVDTMNPQLEPNPHPRDPSFESSTNTWPSGSSRASGVGSLSSQPNAMMKNSSMSDIIEGPCKQFKCSSGECLSWSRICDGLYDCSSHDDERDCHK